MSAPVAAPAPAPAPVASVTLPGGGAITSAMTPLERFNAVAASMGAPPAERPAGLQFGPQGMTPETANEYARREAQFNKTGVSAADADTRARQAAHDTEVAKAKAAPPSAPGVVLVDQQLVDALNAAYRALPAADRSKRTEQFQRELTEAFEGRRFGESRAQFHARTAPGASALSPEQASYNAALDRAVAAQNDKGEIEHTAIDPALTHGYTLPPGKYEGLKDLLDGLAVARKRGWSQAKLDKELTGQ